MKFTTSFLSRIIFLLYGCTIINCTLYQSPRKNVAIYSLLEIAGLSQLEIARSTPENGSVVSDFKILQIRFPYPLQDSISPSSIILNGEGIGSLKIEEIVQSNSKEIEIRFTGSISEGEILILIPNLKIIGRFGEESVSYSFNFIGNQFSPSIAIDFVDGDFALFLDDGFLDLTFSEPMKGALLKSNYIFSEPLASEVTIINILTLGNNKYRLVLSGKPQKANSGFSLSLNNIKDSADQTLLKSSFNYYLPNFKVLRKLITPRCSPQVVRLSSGKIMIIGGIDMSSNRLASIEIFDPDTNEVIAYPFSMKQQRSDFTADLLPNGKVIVTAGLRTSSVFLSDYELIDSEGLTEPITGLLPAQARYGHKSVISQDGILYLLGGRGVASSANPLAYLNRVDRYLYKSNTFENVRNLAVGRDGLAAHITSLGQVIVTGGIIRQSFHTNTFEIYDPNVAVGSNASNTLFNTRRNHTMLRGNSGDFYILGGGNLDKITAIEKISATGEVSLVGNFSEQRYFGGFVFWNDRFILAIGGETDGGLAYSVETINLLNGKVYSLASLPFRGSCTTAFAISSKDILILTGDNPIQRLKLDE